MVDLKDIYHPSLAYSFRLGLIISFILSTFIIIYAIYYVYVNTKNAKVFKYLLINHLIWAYLFCWHCCLCAFVPLYPVPVVYSEGIMKYLPTDCMAWIIPHNTFIGLGFSQAYFFLCLYIIYRASCATGYCKYQPWLEEPKKLGCLMIQILLITSIIFVGPYIFTKYDASPVCKEVMAEYPVLKEVLTHEPSVFVNPYYKLPKSSSLSFALTALQFYLLFLYLAHIAITVVFFRQASKPKVTITESTKQKVMILVKTKILQIISGTILCIIPMIVQTVIFKARSNGSIAALVAQFGPLFYVFFDTLVLIFMIKPTATLPEPEAPGVKLEVPSESKNLVNETS